MRCVGRRGEEKSKIHLVVKGRGEGGSFKEEICTYGHVSG